MSRWTKEEFDKQKELNKDTVCTWLYWSYTNNLPMCFGNNCSYNGHAMFFQVMKKKECMCLKGKHPCKHHSKLN